MAQDDGCNKCEMLREQYESAQSPEKEKIHAFFLQECMQTDSVYTSDKGKVVPEASSTILKIVSKGKCIDYQEVKEFEKASNKQTLSYNVTKKDTVYLIGSTTPVFPGGDIALMKFLSQNIKYPTESINRGESGTVYVRFVVSKTGAVTNVKPIRGPSELLNEEAIRVVKSMPAWQPGTYKSKQVSMVYNLPVKFSMK